MFVLCVCARLRLCVTSLFAQVAEREIIGDQAEAQERAIAEANERSARAIRELEEVIVIVCDKTTHSRN